MRRLSIKRSKGKIIAWGKRLRRKGRIVKEKGEEVILWERKKREHKVRREQKRKKEKNPTTRPKADVQKEQQNKRII